MAMIGLAAPKVSFNMLGSPMAVMHLRGRTVGGAPAAVKRSGRGELRKDRLGFPDDAPQALARRADIFDQAADLAGERRHRFEVAAHVPQRGVGTEFVDRALVLMADHLAREIVGAVTPEVVAMGLGNTVLQRPRGRMR